MLQSLILTDALSSTCWEKEKKKKREAVGGFFPRARGLTHLAGCARRDFHGC
jgi:hypothetical protein